MNNHFYSLEYVLLTLRLVIKHLDFDEEDIFRYGSDKNTPSFKALKEYIDLILSKQKPEDSLPQFIFDYNNDSKNIEKKLHISQNTLSKLSQEVMINGCLIDKSNLKVFTAWTLFCNELCTPWTLLNKPEHFSNSGTSNPKTFTTFLGKTGFQGIFNDFLNTLCALGYQQTVEAFHQFLYITHKVTLHNEKNQTTPEGIAKIQSICLTNGLELEGVLSQIDPSNENTHYSALLKKENTLFFEMVRYLASCEQFSKPFSITDYKPSLSAQFNTTFEKITASIWVKPNISMIPYSNDMFGAVSKLVIDPSDLPVIPDNSETAAEDLRSRSQSPRNPIITEKPQRNKKSFDLFRKKVAKSDEPVKTRKISTESPSHSTDKDKKDESIRIRKISTEGTPRSTDKKKNLSRSTPHLELKAPLSNNQDSILVDKHKKQETPPKRESKSSSPRKPVQQERPQKKESKSNPVLPLLRLTSAPHENTTENKSPVYKSPKRSPQSLGSPKTHVSDIFSHSPQTMTSSSYSSSYYSSEESSHEQNLNHSSQPTYSLTEILGEKPKSQDIDELAKMLEELRFGAELNKSTSETTEESHYFLNTKKSNKEKRGQSASPRANHEKRSEYMPLLPQYNSLVYKPMRSQDVLQPQHPKNKLDITQGSSPK